jgi:TctA family transporter
MASPQFFSRAALVGLTVVIFVLEGPLGLFVAALATCIGLVPPVAGVRRVHLMGCVLLPVSLRIAGL